MYRQHIRVNYLDGIIFVLVHMISQEILFIDAIDNKSALVMVTAWCRTGNKPLSAPTVIEIIDVRNQSSMS